VKRVTRPDDRCCSITGFEPPIGNTAIAVDDTAVLL
jgi:hypothetical protein